MTDKLSSDTEFYLEFVVPIFYFNYIGENCSSQDMWNSKIDFFDNLKEYTVDSERNIVLKRFNYFSDCENLKIDVLSQLDLEYLQQSMWAFELKCKEKDLDDYKQKLNLLLLALRISKQSDLSIKYIICKNNPYYFSSKYSDNWYLIDEKGKKSGKQELNRCDLEEVVSIYNRLKEFFNVSPRTAHAVNFLFLAYTSYYWMAAFMLLMTALETLVSPDERGAIVELVTTRVVSLIDNKNICSKSKFSKIYELRSDIIHGKIFVNINFEKELPKLQQLQRIILTVFKILIEKDYKHIYKDENSKEEFYNELLSNKTV